MIKAITDLSDSVKYYWKKSRGKISIFMNNHIKIFSCLGYILTNMKVRNEVKEDKKARRARRIISGRRRSSKDCMFYVPKRTNLLQ